MKWSSAPLGQVAPPDRSKARFAPDELVWNLQLDQIESQTGRILKKVHARAGDAGTSTFVFDTGHVLYSKLRPYLNKVVRPDEPGLATTELVPLRPVAEVLDPEFLTFFLRSEAFVNFANLTVAGAKMPRMIMDKFWEYHIPIPTLGEQRRIVEILDQADSLRRKREEADELATRILPSLFRKMFGDPQRDSKWPCVPLESVAETTSGGTPDRSNPNYYGGDIPWVKSGELRSGIITITEESITSIGLKNSSAKKMPPGTILLAMYGATVGALAKLGISAATNQAVCCITPGENLDEDYLLTALDLLTPTLLSKRVGGAQPNISQQIIRNLRIPLPPIQQQQIFSSRAQSIREISNKCRASRSGIENLFQAMLYRAFTGELTEGWREAHMKELLAEMELQSKALGKLEEAA